ncbi:integrase arm-type DNA-binding domain-containing protein [Paraperlucidibaca sp.]|uniref:tyrosine-type recombinase/integrase n=1 Tax=Paraperlucidibaca sp. TaxID=2708021 RepID=UPI0030F43A90
MPLTDTAVRNAKQSADGKVIKLSDAGGLYLLIKAGGQKYWRLNYRYMGKQKTLAIGVYPATSLKTARAARDEAKRLLLEDIDPSLHRKQNKAASLELAANSFEAVAREWLARQSATWSDGTAIRMVRSFEADLFPYIGKRPISEIRAPELLAVLRKIEARGAVETAHRVKQRASEVFRYAIATSRAERDPSPDLKGALPPVKQKNFAAIKEPKRIGELLRAIDSYQGTAVVRAAMSLAPLVFVRPANLRQAEWSEIDLDAAIWRIPAEKMKMREQHIVPLSIQAVAILRDIKQLTGNRPATQPYVFPSARAGGRPMSDNAILTAMRAMGIEKDEMTGHGFRHMASTTLHELGWEEHLVEKQLAHGVRNKVAKVYNHAQYLPDRTRMMQAWADYLDGLRTGADVVPIIRTA